MSDSLARALGRATTAERLDRSDAITLYDEADLAVLGQLADAARRRRLGAERVTYLVDRNVNYTNVCITDCTFCAFYRPPRHAESYVLDRVELARKLEDLVKIGGSRVLLQGGHNPELRIEWYEDLLTWLRSAFPTLELDAFSPSEVAHIAGLETISVRKVLERLTRAGLQGLPGGGGENLEPEVRMQISPLKQSGFSWIETMRIAQQLGLVTSATQVIGFGETTEHRVDHMLRIRALQDDALKGHGNGFTSFIHWPMQFENTGLERIKTRRAETATPSPASEYLRHLAVSRLLLDNIEHLQASWPTMGPDVAARALMFGADDYGSTMLEENVVSQAGAAHSCQAELEIQTRIRAAGFRPAKRDPRYRIIAEYAATA